MDTPLEKYRREKRLVGLIRSIPYVTHVDPIDRHDQLPAILQWDAHELPLLFNLMARASERPAKH